MTTPHCRRSHVTRNPNLTRIFYPTRAKKTIGEVLIQEKRARVCYLPHHSIALTHKKYRE